MDTPDHDPIEADRIQAFFDAISSGNLRRVKALLAEEPQLLFADLDDRASPARETLHSEHHDITDYLAREELRRLEEGTVPREHLYGAIHDLGEVAHAETGYLLADQLRAAAEPVVVQFLRHEDPSLRYIALNVLGLHWNLRSYKENFSMMMFNDSDKGVRRLAVSSFGHVFQDSRDWQATETLLRKVRDENEDTSIRETAYEALLSVWYGFWAEHRHFLKVMEARGPLERASNEASAREDYGLSVRVGEQTARVWEDHVDWNFIAALERGQEP